MPNNKPAVVVLGPEWVEGTLPARVLDPEEALHVFEEIAAAAAALHGRFEGPYR